MATVKVRYILLPVVILGVLAAAVLVYLQAQRPVPSPLPINTLLGGDFELPSTLAQNTSLSEFRGRVSLLNFGFTFCPDVCPTVLAKMASVESALVEQGEIESGELGLIFISFDGERDTIERLQQYLPFFSQQLVGFTGTGEQMEPVLKQYGVVAIKQAHGAMGYDFAHSDYIYLLDKQGRIRKLFATDAPSQSIQQDVISLLQEP